MSDIQIYQFNSKTFMKNTSRLSVVGLLIIFSLLVQFSCNKNGSDISPQQCKLEVCVIGDFPDTPYFNALMSEVDIKPLNSSMPIFINPLNIDNLTSNIIGKINMAYKTGMPVTMMYPDHEHANILVQLTGHELPIISNDTVLKNMMLLSVAQLPTQVKDYIVEDELLENEEINNEILRFISWIEENLEVVSDLKAGDNINNLASQARKYSHSQKFTLDGVPYIISSDIQSFYSYSDSSFWVFPLITMEFDPNKLPDNSTYLMVDNIYSGVGYWGPATISNIFSAKPGTSVGSTGYSVAQSHSFSEGVSMSITGPSVSVSATQTYSTSKSSTFPSTDINNLTSLTTFNPGWEFSFSDKPVYVTFSMSWIWQVPYANNWVNGSPSYLGLTVYSNSLNGPSHAPNPSFIFPSYVAPTPTEHHWWDDL